MMLSMIRATSLDTALGTTFSNGREAGRADTTPDKGGSGQGFRPHDLLEAALATCIHMTLRAYARSHGIPLEDVEVVVALDRRPEETLFRYSLDLKGPLSAEDVDHLHRAAAACPGKSTLSKPLRFEAAP